MGSFAMVDHSKQDYLRVRIGIDISKPLIQEFKLKCDDAKIYRVIVQYERLGNYCGIIDHEDSKCEMKFKDNCHGKPVEEIQRKRGLAIGLQTESPKRFRNIRGRLASAPHHFFTTS